jgi:subtilase family serine protease
MKTTGFKLLALLPSFCLASTIPIDAQSYLVGGEHRPGFARPPLRINLNPAATPATAPYTPAQIRHVYGFDQLSATGAGQKIGIVDAYGNQNIQSDLNKFCTQFGLTTTTVQIMGSNPGGNGNGWDMETSLDVEWAHVVAPDATIILSVASDASFSALLNAVAAATNAGATVVSMSWGAQEFSGENGYDPYFQTPGVAYVASSGDSGELTNTPEVEWPAASPYVISVGGTSLTLDSSTSNRISETAWSGSGGGLSTDYSVPSWQVGWSPWLTMRGVPDVAYLADPNTGLYVYCSTYFPPGWYQVGGTSAGAPQWAGLIALANQGRTLGVGGNAPIYQVAQLAGAAAGTLDATHFYDITSGNNGSTADPDDSSGPGYDLVTGLGSPVAAGLVPALVALAPLPPDFSVSVTPSSHTVTPGGATTYTVTVTAVGGFGGTVGLSVSGQPGDAQAGFSSTQITGSGNSTLSITAGSTKGTFTLTITGTSGKLTHSATATLVIATQDFSLSGSPSSLSVRHGSSTSSTITVTPSGGFTGSVSLNNTTVSGPTGAVSPPTVSFSPQPVQVTGGSATSKMTVKTTNRTTLGHYTISVVGTSGSLNHTNQLTLTVR